MHRLFGLCHYCLMMTSDRVVYWNPNKGNLFETTQDNLLDAVVETLVWLIEKRGNLITSSFSDCSAPHRL